MTTGNRTIMRIVLVATWCSATYAQGLLPARNPVYIEDSPAAEQQLARAREFRNQDRLTEAARAYQKIIEQFADKVVATDQEVYTGAARWVRAMLTEDAELLAVYRRLHEGMAQHQLDEATRSESVTSDLERVVAHYGLCRAGFEAGLRLAAMHLEAGRMRDAAAVLDDVAPHLDAAAQPGRYHLLQAAVGLFTGDADRLARHRQELVDRADAERIAQLDDWSARLRRPIREPSAESDSDSPSAAEPGPLGKPLPLYTRPVTAGRTSPTSFLQPVVVGETLYVVERDAVIAIDRNSGQTRWSYTRQAAPVATNRNLRRTVFFGPRSACVVGGRVMAVVGTPGDARNSALHTTALVCLDAQDGRLIWLKRPGDLDESLGTASFHGSPSAAGGLAFVALRRVQQRSIEDAYVAAVDIQTGRMRWLRHLASANQSGSQRAGSPTQWLMHNRRLYVSDVLGVAACLDSRDGSVVWLGRLPAVRQAPQRQKKSNRGPSPTVGVPLLSRPIAVEAGLIIPSYDRDKPPLLLDPENGHKRRVLTGPGWVGARYYLPAGPHVLGVGDTVRLVDGRSLKMLKKCDLPETLRRTQGGVAAVTGRRILVPLGLSLVEIDRDEFTVKTTYDVVEHGDVLAIDGQIIIAGKHHLHSYMNWPQAYARLKRRIAQRPTDPEPALALAHLAFAAGRSEQVLEGADAALDSLRLREPTVSPSQGPMSSSGIGNDAVRHRVFEQLLGLARSDRSDDSLMRALFDRLAAAISGPADTIAYHFALGRFLEGSGNPEQAIEHYQVVLSDRTLSRQLYRWDNGSRRADMEAQGRQADLVGTYAGIYRHYDVVAAQRLDHLKNATGAHWRDFVALAQQYPLASAAPEALWAAGQMLARDGDHKGAIRQLRDAYVTAKRPDLAQKIVERLVELHVQSGQPRRARRWLLTARRDYRGLKLLRHGEPVSVEQWLADLETESTSRQESDALELPLAKATELPGRLLTPSAQPQSAWPDNLLVFQDGGELRLCRGVGFDTDWVTSIGPGDVDLVAFTSQQLIIHNRSTGGVKALDAASGRPLWTYSDLRRLMEKIETQHPQVLADLARLEQLQARNEQIIPRIEARVHQGLYKAVNDQVICFGDRHGRVVAIDRSTGQELWRLTCDLDDIRHFEMDEQILVLSGSSKSDPDARIGTMVPLDPLTGRQRFDMKHFNDQPQWVGLREEGSVICTTRTQVTSFAAADGALNWYVTLSNRSIGGAGFVSRDRLLLAGGIGTWDMIDLIGGRSIATLTNPLPGLRQSLIDVAATDQRWHLLFPQHSIALDAGGRQLWRDAIHVEGKNLVTQFVTGRYVVLVGLLNPDRAGHDGRYAYRLHVLDAQSGRIVDEYDLGPVEHPIDASRSHRVGNHLLLATPASTWVISGS